MNTKNLILAFLCLIITGALSAQTKKNGSYIKWEADENSTEIIKQRNEKLNAQIKADKEIAEKARGVEKNYFLYSFKGNLNEVNPPKNLSEFTTHFHFDPAPQDWAQCCWSYSSTSLFESEIFRKTGKKIKLSEMWSVYHEHLERVERLIDTRGESFYGEGSQMNSLVRLYKKYGIVPFESYTGEICCNVEGRDRRDYVPMYEEIKSYINWVKENHLWDKEQNLAYVKTILNKHMGTPPISVTINGKELTPQEYYKTLDLDVDDYVDITSTLRFDFYTKNLFPYRDNWWHNEDYLNVPLDEYYEAMKKAVKNGYTVGMAGDLSQEPGLYYKDHGIGFIPDFDIPEKYINQESRELRIYNKTTIDDHAVHIVGYTRKDGHDWFLIKETGDPGRESNHRGYIYYRGDYIKLKVLAFFVHKDAVEHLLKKEK